MTVAPPKRQFAMVMDLNKCIGCQTCTVSCKMQWTNRDGREYMYWNNVETRPGQGYPRSYMKSLGGGFDTQGNARPGLRPKADDYGVPWEFNREDLIAGDATPFAHPNTNPKSGPNWDEDMGAGEHPNSFYFYLPRICNHCSNPACLQACPRSAIYKRDEDGIVLVDQERCRGHRFCVESCPYKKVFYNLKISRTEKCLLCYPRIEKGEPPACAKQCVGRIRHFGYRDDKDGPVYKLVEKYKVALPLYADKGTDPNIFYIPPTSSSTFDADGKPSGTPRIPLAYLEELFGPRVSEVFAILQREREKKAAGKPSELMDLLIAYDHNKMFKLNNSSNPSKSHAFKKIINIKRI